MKRSYSRCKKNRISGYRKFASTSKGRKIIRIKRKKGRKLL